MLFSGLERLGQQLSDDVMKEIKSAAQLCTFKKGNPVLAYDDAPEKVYYITQGMVVIKYRVDERESVRHFMLEGDIFVSGRQLFRLLKKAHNIIALENTRCLTMDRAMLIEMSGLHPSLETVRRLYMERYCVHYDDKQYIVTMSPKKRREYMLAQYPQIFHRADDHHLALYLEMKENTLKLIREEMLRKTQ